MNIDDPRLTAYALGELEGAELAEIKAAVAGDEEARRFVEETRAVAGMLAGMRESATLKLTVTQHGTIRAEARKAVFGYAGMKPGSQKKQAWAGWALAAAASVALVAGGLFVVRVGSTFISSPARVASTTPTRSVAVEQLIPVLEARAKERINERDYQAALGVLDQLRSIDSRNAFANSTYSLVTDMASLNDIRLHKSRDFTNNINDAESRFPGESVMSLGKTTKDVVISDLKKGDGIRLIMSLVDPH